MSSSALWRFLALCVPCLTSCGGDTTKPPVVAGVSVTLAGGVLVVRQTTQAVATVKDRAGNVIVGRPVTWSSSDPLVASVSGAGLVTAEAPGTATITAVSDGVSGTALLTVTPPPVASVTVNLTTQQLVQAQTTSATATLRDGTGNELTGRLVSWTTSSSAIATINPSGLITAVAPGAVTITASSEGITGGATLTVIPPPVASVTVSLALAVLPEFRTTQTTAVLRDDGGNLLTGRQIEWTSSAPAVASVSSSGVVAALKPGTTTITAVTEGKSGGATLTVVAATVAVITVSLTSDALVVGQSGQALAVLRDDLGNGLVGRGVTWSSSVPSVATVTSAGVFTAVSPGSASIRATSDGVTGSSSLTVLLSSVSGRLQIAGPQNPSGTKVVLRTRGTSPSSYSGLADAAGDFQFGFPAPADSVDLTVDAGSGARLFRPVVQSISASQATQTLKPLLVPRQVLLTTGSYAATTVTVSLHGAFTPVCSDPSNANCNSFFPGYWTTIPASPILWADTALPVAVAFNRQESTSAIEAADSVAVWAALRQMESDIGRSLFRPANFSDLSPPTNGFSRGAILLSVDQTLVGFGGYANWTWASDAYMQSGKVRFATSAGLRTGGLLAHEMLHTLGFHHSCAWPTALGGYGCPGSSRVTAGDAAAVTLSYDIRRTIQSRAPTSRLTEALRGERTIELGLPIARVFAGDFPSASSVARITLFGRSLFMTGAP